MCGYSLLHSSSLAPLSGFKAAVIRSTSRKRSVSTSSSDGVFSRQQSTRSGAGEFLSALTNELSRFSMEDIPLAAHPSPLPGRRHISSSHELPPDAFEGTEEVHFKNHPFPLSLSLSLSLSLTLSVSLPLSW